MPVVRFTLFILKDLIKQLKFNSTLHYFIQVVIDLVLHYSSGSLKAVEKCYAHARFV